MQANSKVTSDDSTRDLHQINLHETERPCVTSLCMFLTSLCMFLTGFCEYYERIRCSAENTPNICRDLGHEGLAALARASRAPFHICDDDDKRCADWAGKGECRANPGYMLSSCRRACGVCNGHVDISTFFSEEEQHLGDWKWRAARDAASPPPAASVPEAAGIVSDTAEIVSDTVEIVSDTAEIVSDTAEIVSEAAAGDDARDDAHPPPSPPPTEALATEPLDQISAFQRVATSRRAAATGSLPLASGTNAATDAAGAPGAVDDGRRPADDVAAVAPAPTRHVAAVAPAPTRHVAAVAPAPTRHVAAVAPAPTRHVAARAPASSTRSAKPVSPTIAPRTDEASGTYSDLTSELNLL